MCGLPEYSFRLSWLHSSNILLMIRTSIILSHFHYSSRHGPIVFVKRYDDDNLIILGYVLIILGYVWMPWSPNIHSFIFFHYGSQSRPNIVFDDYRNWFYVLGFLCEILFLFFLRWVKWLNVCCPLVVGVEGKPPLHLKILTMLEKLFAVCVCIDIFLHSWVKREF